MAKVVGNSFAFTVNSVSMATAADSVSVGIDVDTPEVTVSASSAKEFLEGDYGASWDMSGPADFGTSLQDATCFALLGGGAVTAVVRPSSGTTTTTNPQYSQSVIMKSYKLDFGIGDAVKQSTSFQGTGVVTRATS